MRNDFLDDPVLGATAFSKDTTTDHSCGELWLCQRRKRSSGRRERNNKAKPSTQAGEFVREEMEHIREGKHGARSTKQAIAIGLSKARRAGVKLPLPESGTVSEKTRRQAKREYARTSEGKSRQSSSKRSRATTQALRKENRQAASKPALARQARTTAQRRSGAERSAAAKKAARTRRTARLR